MIISDYFMIISQLLLIINDYLWLFMIIYDYYDYYDYLLL